MGDVIKGKFGTTIPGCDILLCECGHTLWYCQDDQGRTFGMCPMCEEEYEGSDDTA